MTQIHTADAIQWTQEYEGERFHALLCDPPYHLTSIQKRFGAENAAPAKSGVYARASKGFMGATWDGGDIAFRPETWAAFLPLLYPGAFCMAFAGSRGWHRMAVAIEDAGFLIHPTIFCWATSQGFPKATRIDTQIDKSAGAERKEAELIFADGSKSRRTAAHYGATEKGRNLPTKPATDLAKAWAGHRYGGQVLSPAVEPIIIFQKPYQGRPVDCITQTGAGALNIDGSRIGTDNTTSSHNKTIGGNGIYQGGVAMKTGSEAGRWASNLVMDTDCAERLNTADEFFFTFDFKPEEHDPVINRCDCFLCSLLSLANAGYNDRDADLIREKDTLSCQQNFYPEVAPTAETNTNPEEATKLTAPRNVQEKQLPGSGDNTPNPNTSAASARRLFSITEAIVPFTVLKSARQSLNEQLLRNVRSAGNLCASAEIVIALSIAQTLRGDRAFLHGLDFTHERKKQILTQSLALFVENQEGTDIIPTIATLKMWFGYVLHVMANCTDKESDNPSKELDPIAQRLNNTEPVKYQSKAGRSERDAGLESRCIHPTLKPLRLLRHLATLLLPPAAYAPRRLFVPFAGAGSEVCAAHLAGWEDIQGIEMEEEYAEIARARLKFWAGNSGLFEELTQEEEDPEQFSLDF